MAIAIAKRFSVTGRKAPVFFRRRKRVDPVLLSALPVQRRHTSLSSHSTQRYGKVAGSSGVDCRGLLLQHSQAIPGFAPAALYDPCENGAQALRDLFRTYEEVSLSFDPDLASHSGYLGRTFEAMTNAKKYTEWILSSFRPYLGRRLVEVGAGQGNFSKFLLQTSPEAFAGVEPDPAMFRVLEKALAGISNVTLISKFLSEVHEELPFIPDTVLYVNVLEHIKDDAGELRCVHRALSPKGKICIFVPALQILYGSADASMGHHRRYEKEGLSDLVSSAGFHVVKISYFDCVGIIPWFILFRLFKSESLKPSQVQVYDKLIVPLLRRAESACPPPWGKNLLIVGQKV